MSLVTSPDDKTERGRSPSFPRIISVITWMVFMVPFCTYGMYIFRFAANIPMWDDYSAILQFMNRFVQVQVPERKLELLFSLHNEHRIVFSRIIFLLYYFVFHEVNFKFYIVFGNLGWILTTLMLVLYFEKNLSLSLAQLLPIPYLLLSLSHTENMFWAMASIQNYWFVFFSIAFLICLSKDRPLLFSVLFPVALFTSGGGIVLYPLGNLFLALRRKWVSLAFFFVMSTLLMVFYFHGYHRPPASPSILDAVLSPLRTTEYFFAFWGNIFPRYALPLSDVHLIIIGLILCLLTAYLVFTQHIDAFLRLAIGFIALIALTTALTRSGLGVLQAASSKYSLYPLLLLAFVYVYVVTSISILPAIQRVVLVGALLVAVPFWGIGTVVYGQHTYTYFLNTKKVLINSIVAFNNGDKASLVCWDTDWAADLLLTAQQQHIYDYQGQKP